MGTKSSRRLLAAFLRRVREILDPKDYDRMVSRWAKQWSAGFLDIEALMLKHTYDRMERKEFADFLAKFWLPAKASSTPPQTISPPAVDSSGITRSTGANAGTHVAADMARTLRGFISLRLISLLILVVDEF